MNEVKMPAKYYDDTMRRLEALNRIKVRLNVNGEGDFSAEVISTDENTGVSQPACSLVRVSIRKILGIFRKEMKTRVLIIWPGFLGDLSKIKELNCILYEESLRKVVDEELHLYMKDVGATGLVFD